jgi:hypothetical protein
LEDFTHGAMMKRAENAVNCPDGQVFRGCHGGRGFARWSPCAGGRQAVK